MIPTNEPKTETPEKKEEKFDRNKPPKDKKSWWKWFKKLPKNLFRISHDSATRGTLRREEHPASTATCRVDLEDARNREITKVTIRTAKSKKTSPEAQVESLAKRLAGKKLGRRWNRKELVLVTEVTPL